MAKEMKRGSMPEAKGHRPDTERKSLSKKKRNAFIASGVAAVTIASGGALYAHKGQEEQSLPQESVEQLKSSPETFSDQFSVEVAGVETSRREKSPYHESMGEPADNIDITFNIDEGPTYTEESGDEYTLSATITSQFGEATRVQPIVGASERSMFMEQHIPMPPLDVDKPMVVSYVLNPAYEEEQRTLTVRGVAMGQDGSVSSEVLTVVDVVYEDGGVQAELLPLPDEESIKETHNNLEAWNEVGAEVTGVRAASAGELDENRLADLEATAVDQPFTLEGRDVIAVSYEDDAVQELVQSHTEAAKQGARVTQPQFDVSVNMRISDDPEVLGPAAPSSYNPNDRLKGEGEIFFAPYNHYQFGNEFSIVETIHKKDESIQRVAAVIRHEADGQLVVVDPSELPEGYFDAWEVS